MHIKQKTFDTKRLAKHLKVHPNTIYTWVRNFHMPVIRANCPGSRMRFDYNAVLDWMRQN